MMTFAFCLLTIQTVARAVEVLTKKEAKDRFISLLVGGMYGAGSYAVARALGWVS